MSEPADSTASARSAELRGETWSTMTAEERRAARIEKWRKPGVEFASPQAKADYEARIDRLVAALDLRQPDRVPVNLNVGLWPAARAGMTPYEVMHDAARAADAWVDFNLEFQADTMVSPLMYSTPASLFEALDYRLYSWPGHGVANDATFQYNEKEWMLSEEYDDLIDDPSDYLLRTYLPRAVGAFAGFAGLSSLLDFIELPFVSGHVGGWGSAEMAEGLEHLEAAARVVRGWEEATLSRVDRLKALGFPQYYGGVCKAPFDTLGDSLRGMRGLMMDMFRRPEKVRAACERLVPVTVKWSIRRPRKADTPIIFIPLHKGADGFMNDGQFHEFYWPTLRAVLLALIEDGYIPLLFAEGRYGSRLEVITDLPRGKTVWVFDQTDMSRAKETIGRVACIQGNVPLSLMHAGTAQEVVDYTRKLIETAGVGGGYILDMGAGADNGRAENLHAMIDTARKYGVY